MLCMCVFTLLFSTPDERKYDYDNNPFFHITPKHFFFKSNYNVYLCCWHLLVLGLMYCQGCHSEHIHSSAIPFELYVITQDEIWCRGRVGANNAIVEGAAYTVYKSVFSLLSFSSLPVNEWLLK